MKGDVYQVGDIVRVLSIEEIIEETGVQPDPDGTIIDFVAGMHKFCGKLLEVSEVGYNEYGKFIRVKGTSYVFYDWCTENMFRSIVYDEDSAEWKSLMEGM